MKMRGAAAPDAGFDQIPGHAVLENIVNAELKIIEPRHRQHRDRGPLNIVINEPAHEDRFAFLARLRCIDCVGQSLLQQVKVETGRCIVSLLVSDHVSLSLL